MESEAKKNKLSDFKVGQTVSAVFINDTTKRKVDKILVQLVYLDDGSSWMSPSSLYIHKDVPNKENQLQLASLVNSMEEVKKEISLERLKEVDKMLSSKAKTRKFSNKSSRSGYVVRALIKDGAASKAGICIGDTISLVDGRSVVNSAALGNILKTYRDGAKVGISVKKPDGRMVFIKNVVLKSDKSKTRATLGVISSSKSAAKYNEKIENLAKVKAVKASEVVKSAIADVSENEFMARARIEMEGVAALMADMKGRDALMKTNNLRENLKKELRKGMDENAQLVNNYLECLRNAGEDKPAKVSRTLSTKGKVVFSMIGLSTVAISTVAVAHFVMGIL
jgi:hypothetical protein